MNIDPNMVVCVIAICAIISPIAVAIINNRHHRKMRELELAMEREAAALSYLRGIYEEYLRSASTRLYDDSFDIVRDYEKSYVVSFVYFPPKSHDMLRSIDSAIKRGDRTTAASELTNLSVWLSSLIREFL